MSIPKKFRLPFSEGPDWILKLLAKHSYKAPSSQFEKTSKALYKQILQINKYVEELGIPPHLELAHVHPDVQMGVFLKPTEKAIPAGTLIGVYTGLYQAIESDSDTNNSYSYDVAADISLNKEQKKHVVDSQKKAVKGQEYSIQTNAIPMGNFTRYINHSLLYNNIEATLHKLPGGRLEILLTTTKKIYPGEQLLSSYGSHYWKALSIIPNDIKPNTYMLTASKGVKLVNPMKNLSARCRKFLTPLRHDDIDLTEAAEKSALVKDLAADCPSLTVKQEEMVDHIGDILVERALFPNLDLSFRKNGIKVTLKEDEKPIAKNKLIGVLSGVLTLSPTKKSLFIAQRKNTTLYLDHSEEGNFLTELPRCEKKGNLIARLAFDDREDDFVLLVFTTRKILPKEELILKGVSPPI